MNIFSKKAMFIVSCMAMSVLLLSSCGERNDTELDYLAVKLSKNEGWSIIDKNGKVVVEDEYPSDAEISNVSDGVYWVKTGNTFQLFSINSPKKPIVDEEFTRATTLNSGYAAVSAPNQPIRIINTRGKIVSTLSEDIKRCYAFSKKGLAFFMNVDDKFGIIDKNGKIVVKAEYCNVFDYDSEIFLAKKNEDDKKLLIINTEGKKLGTIDLDKYELRGLYSEGKILVTGKDDNDNRLIALDTEGKRLFSIKKSGSAYSWGTYKDGYVQFANSEGKYGVADDEGNEVIRAKYNSILNLGNGEFAACKEEGKWGVVNYKDEIILDFDYSEIANAKMGENYLVKDGKERLLVKKGEKETVLVSFYETSFLTSGYATYVSTNSIVNKIVKTIEEYEQPRTAAQLAKTFGLSAENYKWDDEITRTVEIDDDISLKVSIEFYSMTRQKTHTERVGYGYFSYNRTVSDGWFWTDYLPYKISASITENSNIDNNAVYTLLKSHVEKGRKKVAADNDRNYYKTVKYDGSETKAYTYLSNREGGISFIINYGEYHDSFDYNYVADDIDYAVDSVMADTVVADW